MTKRKIPLILILVLLLFSAIAGCVTYSFSDVSYRDGAIHATVDNAGEPREVVVQVTVFETSGFSQKELFKKADYLFLETGSNEYVVPADLDEGTYKLYLYVTVDGARTICEIRDIEV